MLKDVPLVVSFSCNSWEAAGPLILPLHCLFLVTAMTKLLQAGLSGMLPERRGVWGKTSLSPRLSGVGTHSQMLVFAEKEDAQSRRSV